MGTRLRAAPTRREMCEPRRLPPPDRAARVDVGTRPKRAALPALHVCIVSQAAQGRGKNWVLMYFAASTGLSISLYSTMASIGFCTAAAGTQPLRSR